MSNVKQPSKRKRRSKAVPVLGIAGVSLAVAGGASASTTGQATDTLSQNTSPRHEVFLGEQEISDVSLSTFYVFDKENAAKPQAGEKVAWGGWLPRLQVRRLQVRRLGRLRRLRRLRRRAASLGDVAAPAKRHGPNPLDRANRSGRVFLDPASSCIVCGAGAPTSADDQLSDCPYRQAPARGLDGGAPATEQMPALQW